MKFKLLKKDKVDFPIIGRYWNHPGQKDWWKITRLEDTGSHIKVWGVSNINPQEGEKFTTIKDYQEALGTSRAYNLAKAI